MEDLRRKPRNGPAEGEDSPASAATNIGRNDEIRCDEPPAGAPGRRRLRWTPAGAARPDVAEGPASRPDERRDAAAMKIVLCFDGTWRDARRLRPKRESKRTNVSKTYNAIRDGEHESVKACYFPGVGTKLGERILGGVLGFGLSGAIRAAYARVVEHSSPGDRLYLFGYSRGAYTARSLAGLIDLCGVPKAGEMTSQEIARKAMKIYRIRNRKRRERCAAAFRADPLPGSSEESGRGGKTEVWFVGVWDTVGALGVPINGVDFLLFGWRDRFHDVQLGKSVRHGYHALAIDEKRRPYMPTLWDHPPKSGQCVEQVWFPGAHGDLGGDAESDALSDVALHWMWSKAAEAGLPLDPERNLVRPDECSHGELKGRRPFLHWLTRYVRPIGKLSKGEPVSACEAAHVGAYLRLRCERCDYGAGGLGANFAEAVRDGRVKGAKPACAGRTRWAPPQGTGPEVHGEDEEGEFGAVRGLKRERATLPTQPSAEQERKSPGDRELRRLGVDQRSESERERPERPARTVPRRRVLRRLRRSLALAWRGIGAIGFGVACLLVSVLVGGLAFAAVYRYVRESDFLVTAAAIVSFAFAFQMIFLFGQRLVEVLGRFWGVLVRTLRDVWRAWKETPAD